MKWVAAYHNTCGKRNCWGRKTDGSVIDPYILALQIWRNYGHIPELGNLKPDKNQLKYFVNVIKTDTDK